MAQCDSRVAAARMLGLSEKLKRKDNVASQSNYISAIIIKILLLFINLYFHSSLGKYCTSVYNYMYVRIIVICNAEYNKIIVTPTTYY